MPNKLAGRVLVIASLIFSAYFFITAVLVINQPVIKAWFFKANVVLASLWGG